MNLLRRALVLMFVGCSLAVWFAISILWVRGYFHSDQLWVWRQRFQDKICTERQVSVESRRGGISLRWDFSRFGEDDVERGTFPLAQTLWSADHDSEKVWAYPTLPDDVLPGHQLMGFAFGYSDIRCHQPWRGGHLWVLIFPCPALWLVAAILPGGMYVNLIRRRRLKGNFCLDCGYDLRATPDRCPECGRTVQSAGVI